MEPGHRLRRGRERNDPTGPGHPGALNGHADADRHWRAGPGRTSQNQRLEPSLIGKVLSNEKISTPRGESRIRLSSPVDFDRGNCYRGLKRPVAASVLQEALCANS